MENTISVDGLGRKQKEITKKEKLIKRLEMGNQFITFMKLEGPYLEFEKTLQPKTFQQKLEEKKIEALKQNQNRKKEKQEVMGEKKQLKENEILF